MIATMNTIVKSFILIIILYLNSQLFFILTFSSYDIATVRTVSTVRYELQYVHCTVSYNMMKLSKSSAPD